MSHIEKWEESYPGNYAASQAWEREHELHSQIAQLATVLLDEFGGPTCNESACEMAVRVLREQQAEIERLRVEQERDKRETVEMLSQLQYDVALKQASSEAEVERLRVIIKDLLNALPDSGYEGRGDESWDWCWNELSSEAQDEVKAVRARAKTAYNR